MFLNSYEKHNDANPATINSKLYRVKWWNLPLLEFVSFVVGLVLEFTNPEILSDLNRLGGILNIAGFSGLIAGIPLLFIPLRVRWVDFCYIGVGLPLFLYFRSFLDGSYIFLNLFLFLGLGMIVSGFSYSLRRSLALRFAIQGQED